MSRIASWAAYVYKQQSDSRRIRPLLDYTEQQPVVVDADRTARVNTIE
jgi:hypothetical protein